MFRKLFQGISKLFESRPYHVHLERHENQILFIVLRGEKFVHFTELMKKYGQLDILLDFQVQYDTIVFPVWRLPEVKQALDALVEMKKIEVHIPEAVENLQAVTMPEDFEVRYIWTDDRICRRLLIPDGVVYLGAGWFARQDRYWQVEGTTGEDDEWLSKEIIAGREIITLLTRKASEWKERALPFTCAMKYTEEPLFRITIKDVFDDVVDLEINFKADADHAEEIPSLDDFVTVGDTVMPGVIPAKVFAKMIGKSGIYRLRDEAIPSFLVDIRPKVSKWIDGNKAELRAMHRIIYDYELTLSYVREELNGVGVLSAIPAIACDDRRLRAEGLSRQISNYKSFVPIYPGWIPIRKLRQLGLGPLGRSDDGGSLAPIPLTPAEVLNRGSDRLRGPWTRIEAPELIFPEGKDVEETALLHLEFLRTWGLPGGIISEPKKGETALYKMLSALLHRSAGTRILLIATRKRLNSLSGRWRNITAARFDGSRKDPGFSNSFKGVVLTTPKALESIPAISSLKWDIVCLFDADLLVREASSRLAQSLLKCSKVLTLGLFAGSEFLNHASTRETLSRFFGISPREDSLLWKYGLRNPAEHAPSAPVGYQYITGWQSGAAEADAAEGIEGTSEADGPAEFTVGDATSGPQSAPIPPRPEVAGSSGATDIQVKSSFDLKDLGIRVEISYPKFYSHNTNRFVKAAGKAADHREVEATHIPFNSYYPSHDSMTRRQRKWYFYWRSLIRDGKHQYTDHSYIYLYVHELINNIGVKDAREGYEQLTRTWLFYRDIHPKLDDYLIDWIFDYALINRYPADPLEIMREALRLNVLPRFFDIDLLVPRYIKESLVQVPLRLIEVLSNHRTSGSKFFNEGYQSLLEEYIPRSLDEVSRHMAQKLGGGIFELYQPKDRSSIRRNIYRGALYNITLGTIKMDNVIPYSQHAPLREFLTAIVKYTENRLREANNFKGRLRGYSIDPEIQIVIDNLIPCAPSAAVPVSPTEPDIVIDFTRVRTLIKQSDQVLQMLQTGEDKASEKQPETADAPTPVRDVPPGSPLSARHDTARESARAGGASDHHPPTGQEKAQTAHEDLPEEWTQFRAALTEHHYQVLRAIVTMEDPMVEISRIAGESAAMPEFLIDSINEIALDTLGDMIIEPGSAPPAIEEENLESVRKLLQAREY